MGLWPWTKRKKVEAVGQLMLVRAKFDAAQTTPDNRKHWANADYFSADAAANPEVRRTLRSRARYEVANNSYARGIVLTLANDVIGTGPRLQMLLGDGENAGTNRTIEAEFGRWARAVGLGEAYHEHRRQTMLARQLGLTKTYNLFHNRECTDADIARLRELHAEMDRAVLACYGWTDLDPGHGFHANDRGQMRFTVSPAARREILRRLLALNLEIAAREAAAGERP